MSKWKLKSTLITFCDTKRIVHKEFVPSGKTVNANFYKEVLQNLRNRIARVYPELTNNFILHHDNAPIYTDFKVSQFLAKHSVATLPQLLYSPDLSSPDFFLLSWLKSILRGHRFDNLENLQKNVNLVLNSIPFENFQVGINWWQNRWQRVLMQEGLFWRIWSVCKIILK